MVNFKLKSYNKINVIITSTIGKSKKCVLTIIKNII